MGKRYGPSKYKYVTKSNRDRKGEKINKWMGCIPNYRDGAAWSKLYDTERQAAIEVDRAFIRIGKKPVNILKKIESAELKNICSKWLWKAFETGTKQDPFSADNSEYWHPSIDLKWSKEMAEEIDEYTQQVSRERSIEFLKYCDNQTSEETLRDEQYEAMFDNWQKQK